jgi:hypothetical protein
MAINSIKAQTLSGLSNIQDEFTRSELAFMFSSIGSNGGTAFSNYLATAGTQNLSKSQILSAARYLAHLQSAGYTTYQSNGNYYAYVIFTTVGTISSWNAGPFNNANADLLVVAGGGSSSTIRGGGGGAGGLLQPTSVLVSGNKTVTVGQGGVGGASTGNNGQNSVFDTYISIGGGRGGWGGASGTNGANGGSGGGGGYIGDGAFSVGTAGQGTAGHRSINDGSLSGGGGGGAGVAGGRINGGNGIQSSITGTAIYYAGGGNGIADSAGSSATAGLGANTQADGSPNTGAGAGASTVPRNGGSGVVIVRFPFTIPTVFGA